MNNVLAPTTFTSLFVADQGANDPVPTPTKSGSNSAAACAEFQSTSGGVLLPRMTQAQINAAPAGGQALIPGTIVYNSTVGGIGTIGGGGAYSGGLLTATGVLTDAEVLVLDTEPKLLVNPPDAGYGIFIIKAVLAYNYVAAFVDGGSFFFSYDNEQEGASQKPAAFPIDAAPFRATVSSVSSTYGKLIIPSAMSGCGIYLSSEGTFFAGEGSTIRYIIQYVVVPV